MIDPEVTIVIPSFNQGDYLEDALISIFQQDVRFEVFLLDAGSTDGTLDIIRKWEDKLTGWRSQPDHGQAAAINEGIAQGSAPYVCWLNSDDMLLAGGMKKLLDELKANLAVPAVYGRSWNLMQNSGRRFPDWVEPINPKRMAYRCIISQPATLIRRDAWEKVKGVDESLSMAMDYDLWWRLYKQIGPLQFLDEYVAVNRDHRNTKTNTQRSRHYYEAIKVVREHYGKVPLKWWLAQPYAVWLKSLTS